MYYNSAITVEEDSTILYGKRRNFGMAHVISDDCIACGACAAECPVEAISEGDDKYVVDADTCVDCGACEDVCPQGAIAGE